MEKLLSPAKKTRGNYATNIAASAQKYFLNQVGYENIFANTTTNIKKINCIQDVLSSSTNNGITIKTSQLFSGRFILAIENKSASVSADGIRNIPPSAIPSR